VAQYGDNYNYGQSPYYKDEGDPFVPGDYYFDFDRIELGIGSVIDPCNYEQFVNYFDPADGTPCNLAPTFGDVLNIKGVANLIGRTYLININNTVDGMVTVRPWSITQHGIWLVETRDLDASSITFIKNESDNYITNLVVGGFAFLQNNISSPTAVKITDITYSGTGPVIAMKNCMIYCRDGNVDLSANANCASKYYGYSILANEVDFGYEGSGNLLYLDDGSIKTNLLIDSSPS